MKRLVPWLLTGIIFLILLGMFLSLLVLLERGKTTIITVDAPIGQKGCKVAFSIERTQPWSDGPVEFGDGGGFFDCNQLSEVEPGLVIKCYCSYAGEHK